MEIRLKESARENWLISSSDTIACRSRHHEEPTLHQFFNRKYLLELDYFSCVLPMDTLLHVCGLSKDLDYQKCLKKLVKNWIRSSGVS